MHERFNLEEMQQDVERDRAFSHDSSRHLTQSDIKKLVAEQRRKAPMDREENHG